MQSYAAEWTHVHVMREHVKAHALDCKPDGRHVAKSLSAACTGRHVHAAAHCICIQPGMLRSRHLPYQ